MNDEDPCSQCGSTEFNLEDDGRTYCPNGHDQGRGVITGEDEADFGRLGKVVRKKVPKTKVKASKILRGVKAYQLYLQIWQLILWKQCYILIHEKGIPSDLWGIVRDLWTLWLQKLEPRLQEESADGVPDLHSQNESGAEQDLYDSSENDADEEQDRPGKKAMQSGPKLIDTVVLLYISTLLVRYFTPLDTLHKWLTLSTIPYIRAIRHIPHDMLSRLPSEYHHSFDPIRVPTRDHLQRAIYLRVNMFHFYFGMSTPALNRNLLLVHYMRELALPLEVYGLARRVAKILGFTFSYQDDEDDDGDDRRGGSTGDKQASRRHATSYPEAQAISSIMIATKLLFPLSQSPTPATHGDSTLFDTRLSPNTMLQLDWNSWLEAKENFDAAVTELETDHGKRMKPGTELNITEEDILAMPESQLDQYMDWYQETWIDAPSSRGSTQNDSSGNIGDQSQQQWSSTQDEQTTGIDRTFLNLFPLHPLPPNPTTTHHTNNPTAQSERQRTALLDIRIQSVQASLTPLQNAVASASAPVISITTPTETASDRPTPHHQYRPTRTQPLLHPQLPRYPHLTTPADLHRAGVIVQTLHEEAARAACLSVPALLRAVNRAEDRLETWRRARRRAEMFAEDEKDVAAVVPATAAAGGEEETGGGLQDRFDDEVGDRYRDDHGVVSTPGTLLARDMLGMDLRGGEVHTAFTSPLRRASYADGDEDDDEDEDEDGDEVMSGIDSDEDDEEDEDTRMQFLPEM